MRRVAAKQQRSFKLSQCLGTYPTAFDGSKISIVQKYVTEFDTCASRFQFAEVIFGSNNSLTSLEGVQQFRLLRVLSLGNNCVDDIRRCGFLRHCACLQVLSMEGNPIEQSPYYRAHLLSIVPWVKVLDSKEVSEDEVRACDSIIKRENACLDQMLENSMRLQFLERGAKTLQLHVELKAIQLGRMAHLNNTDACPEARFDVNRYLRLLSRGTEIAAGDVTSFNRDARKDACREWCSSFHMVRPSDDVVYIKDDRRIMQNHPVPARTKTTGVNESWDKAYAACAARHSRAMADMHGFLEEQRQRAVDVVEKYLGSDPGLTLRNLREEVVRVCALPCSPIFADVRLCTQSLPPTTPGHHSAARA